MFNLIRQWFYICTKCQADLWPFIQCHSFGLPHTYQNIGFSEITGLFDGLFIGLFKVTWQKWLLPPYMVKQEMFYYKLCWPWPILTLLMRSGERLRTFRSSSLMSCVMKHKTVSFFNLLCDQTQKCYLFLMTIDWSFLFLMAFVWWNTKLVPLL